MTPEPAALIMQGSDRCGRWGWGDGGKRREKGGGDEDGAPARSSPTNLLLLTERGLEVTSHHTCGQSWSVLSSPSILF